MTKDGSTAAHARPPSKWPERVFFALAAVLLAVCALAFGLSGLVDTLRDDGITREVASDFAPVDRVETSPSALRGFNVLIITTDTTRADHIGCYGNRSVKTPVIDGLARDGILCAQAVTPSPSTLPSHASLLTGLYPVHHGARANGTFRLDEKVTTLAERLKARGYRTGAVISAFVLDSRFGLDQGFDLYHDDLAKGMKYSAHMFRERAAELTNEPATEWLRENADEPFFLWIHYFDPHAVYLPPEPFRSQYADDPYDGEIAYVDSQIGVLLDELQLLGVREKTLVVYTSDHGEGLGEHSEQTHSMLVYDSTMQVPLIFHAPAELPRGVVLRRQTCLVDIVPTVLSLLGEEVPDDLDGVNLCEPSADAMRTVLIETIATMTLHGWAPLLGVRRDDFKYILAPTPELYDLKADPWELNNLHDDRPNVARELRASLVSRLGDDPFLATRKVVDLTSLDVDAETLRRLSALGYVSTSSHDVGSTSTLADPKDMIDHWESVQKAVNLRAQGEPMAAIAMLEQALAEVPHDVYARSALASAYRQMGDDERALVHFQRAAEDEPNNETVRLGMASIYISQGKYSEAEEMINKALEIVPELAEADLVRGQMAMRRGREAKAIELFQRTVDKDPGTSGPIAYNQLGSLHLHAGRLDDAREAFQQALRIDVLNGSAHDGLAKILQAEGKEEEAMAELQVALRFDPNQPAALVTLASLISKKGDAEKALSLCRRALEISPKFAPAHNILGLVHRRQGDLDLAEEHYGKAIQLDPQLEGAYVNLAQLYARQGKTEEALKQFRLAVDMNPRYPHPVAVCNVGVYHFNRAEFKQARQCFQRALVRDPDHALAHRQLGYIYTLSEWDRPDLTAFHLRRSLELDPRQAEAPQMRELLARADKEAARRREDHDPQESTNVENSEPAEAAATQSVVPESPAPPH